MDLSPEFNLNNPHLVSVLDELPLWSAPFGMKLLNQIEMKPGMKVLDIGCGTGFPLIELAMRLGPESRVYGLDPWKEGLARARMKANIYSLQNVEFVEGIAENMPFPDHFFDLIVSNNGLNNGKDIRQCFKECKRVGKPDAQLVYTLNTDKTMHEFYSILRDVFEGKGLSSHLDLLKIHIQRKRPDIHELVQIASEEGIETYNIEHDHFSFRYATGTAMLNHGFIRLAFLPSWLELLPPNRQNEIMLEVETRLNLQAKEIGECRLTIPYAICECDL